MGCAIRTHSREAIGGRDPRAKALDRGLCIIRRIRPGPVRPQRERAKAVRARRAGLCGKHRLACIRIRDGERSAHRQCGRVVFGHITCRRASDYGPVIDTGDRDHDHLGCAIRTHSREAIGGRDPRAKALDRGLCIIRRIRPGPVRPQRERAKAVRARRAGLCGKHRLACIRIRHRQRAAGRKRRRRILGHRPGGVAANNRDVVHAGIAPTGCRRSGSADQPRGRPRSPAVPGHRFRQRSQLCSHRSGDRNPATLQNNKIPSRIDAHRPVRERHLQRTIRQHTCRRHSHVGAQNRVSILQRPCFS